MPLNIDITRDPYFKRGELRGLKRGEKLGEKRGEKLGEKRGEKRNREQVALKMLNKRKFSDEEIVEISGLSREEVLELKKRLRN